MTKNFSVCLVVLLALSPHAQGDIVIQGYTDATNNRFTNSPSFIASNFNLSGIGLTAGAVWGTLVSPNVIVSATHYPPSGAITFFPNNDPSSTAVTRQVTGNTMQINNSDVWVAQLDTPVDSTITFFPFGTAQLTGPSNAMNGPNDPLLQGSAGIYAGLDGYVVGRSPGNNDNTQDHAIGRNVISYFAKDVPQSGLTDTLVFEINNSHPFEATLAQYDSGAPFFVDINNQLVLLGVNSINDIPNNVAGGVAYLGNQETATAIQSFINSSAVPEPSAWIYTSLMLLGMTHRSRQRRSI